MKRRKTRMVRMKRGLKRNAPRLNFYTPSRPFGGVDGEKYIGTFEIAKPNGDYDVWEVVKRGRVFVIGTATNTGLLSDYYFKMEQGESEQKALEEINADLEVLATDGPSYMSRVKKIPKKISTNSRRGLRRNQTPMERLRYHVSGAVERGESRAIAGMPMEYARQIPRRDRPMRGRGFDKRFDVSAGSDYNDLYKILTTGRNPGTTKKIGDNTYLFFEKRAPMGYPPILEGPIVVKLYQTPILTYYPNGEVDVNFGGYMTTTTFSRINNLVPYGWNLRKKAGKLALENSWGQRAVIRKPRAGEEYAVRLTSDKAYLID